MEKCQTNMKKACSPSDAFNGCIGCLAELVKQANDKIRRRNLQIKELKAKHIELEKQLNKAEDRLGQEGIWGY